MAKIITLGGKAMSSDNKEPLVDKDGNTIIPTEPSEWLDGVQIWEKGILVGVALYKNTSTARAVRDILNRKYAELQVDHEAKIMKYPVY